MTRRKTWIIAYDIASPRRLARVHKLLSKHAFPLQYSVFAADLSENGLARLMERLGKIIDPTRDDIRFYAAPPGVAAEMHGRGRLPEGMAVFGEGAAGLAGRGQAKKG